MDWQRTLLIVLVLVVLGGGYYYYQVYNVAPTPEGGNQVVAGIDAKLNDIRPLASVEFDTSILNNAFFRSLKVIPAPPASTVVPGRANPFLPY